MQEHAPSRGARNFVRGVRALCVLALVWLSAACSEQALYSRLTEQQANEMVAVLRMAGLPAEKVVRESDFAVTTSTSAFAQAVQTLNAMGLPREQFDSLGKVFKREGFVSSPLEERSRLMHAMSQELSHTLSSIDGVLLARVTLVVPEKHPLSDKIVPASAGVFIKHRPGMDVASLVPKIKALVVNSVEGLPYEGVTVEAFAAERWLMPTPPEPGPLAALQAPLLTAGAVGLLALLVATGLWAWRRHARAQAQGDAAGHLPAVLRSVPVAEGQAGA